MEERTVHQGDAGMPPANTAGGGSQNAAPPAQSNNAATPPPTGASAPAAPIPPPPAAGIPDDTVRTPPPMPRAENTPDTLTLRMEHAPVFPAMREVPMPEKHEEKPTSENCGYKQGELPPCAPLAAGYVPFQSENPPKYAAPDALTHGTLFPGLDLPFMNVANKSNPYAGTPLGEVMALDFAVHELTLYLDTHKDDRDAFEMLKTLLALSREGRRAYEKLYGPIDIRDLEYADKYTWLSDPWPWEYWERRK